MQNMSRVRRAGQNGGKLNCVAAALCDVDSNVLAAAASEWSRPGTKPQVVGDYRQLLDRKDIDAVVVSTPDHWHALMTIHACQAGKDVYCEKPLTLHDRRRPARWSRPPARPSRVVQTGSQQRAATTASAWPASWCATAGSARCRRCWSAFPSRTIRRAKPVPDSDPPQRARLRHVARPGSAAAVQREPRALQLPLLLGLLRRPDDQLWGAPPRHRPVGPGHGRQRPGRQSKAPARSTRKSISAK